MIIFGFALLIKGADFLVDGAAALARRMRISDLTISLTVVAFGTSAPELVVNVAAGLDGKTDLAVGNVLGSNIANIFLILGVSALIMPLRVTSETVWREIPMAFLATAVLAVLAGDQVLNGAGTAMISRSDGLVLLCFFAVFIYYTIGSAMKDRGAVGYAPSNQLTAARAAAYLAVGLAGLVIGGQWIVAGAVSLSRTLGISEIFIGLTVIAFGTSLPELATSTMAAYKGNADIAVGNVVGSNIFNIFFVLGAGALIRPLPLDAGRALDMGIAASAGLLLFFFMFTGRRFLVDRWEGALLILFYIAYIGVLFMTAL
jgi:cation:H+ antiporter